MLTTEEKLAAIDRLLDSQRKLTNANREYMGLESAASTFERTELEGARQSYEESKRTLIRIIQEEAARGQEKG